MKLISQSLVGRAVGPSSGLAEYITYYYTCLELLQTVNAVSSSCVTLKIFFLGLGVTVTEINIKKVRKQHLKNIKNGKRCRDGMPKSMQKGRDDVIVKISSQSSIPTSFYITVANLCENDIGMKICKLTFTITSSLPCLHTFCMAFHPYIFLHLFKSCSK